MGKKVRIYLAPDIPASRHDETEEEKDIAPDLLIIHIWIALTVATLMIPALAASLFRYIFTIPVLIFIPGYCLTAVLFSDTGSASDLRRVSLALGLSVALVSLVMVCLNYSAWGIQLNTVIFFILILTLLSGPVIQYRRSRLPREIRFRLSLSRPAEDGRKRESPQETPRGNRTLYTIVLVLILAILCSPTMYILNMTIPRGKDTGISVKYGCISHQDSTTILENMSPAPLTIGSMEPVTTPARNETSEGEGKNRADGPPRPVNATNAGSISRAGPGR
jgi:uncharacterized membrane protein